MSHFNYLRDNTLFTWMHLRLFAEAVVRAPALLWRRLTGQAPFAPRRASDATQPNR